MVSSRGCRRGPQDRGKPTVRSPSGSSPTGGEYACVRIQKTDFLRPHGLARGVRRRVAREGSGAAASAICATPCQGSVRHSTLSGGLRFAPTPGYSLACLRHAGGTEPPHCPAGGGAAPHLRQRAGARLPPSSGRRAIRSWPCRPRNTNSALTDRRRGGNPLAVVAVRNLAVGGAGFWDFVRAANMDDAGESAAREFMRCGLADAVTGLLGDGPWAPDPEKWDREDEAESSSRPG